ncbi:transcription factor tau 95, putative [Ichthyophthirius multifiliis]|uniref:Transcription factor tau 95, putative n=1 Tax=Ichthyophthirius multifiliis TaxID=5932 RepID=G0R0P4_ICHMU|nr:transcription factor tau 95, putative [Ichthyophthirius multifiliis]EGR28959.1 transcription factor tau 95, putative [Ichthyophthirius multifiliis]|eukprot:XP_004030195.1 transcription factor tau 95, putative [Ichthyophthirius multifiliis]
MKCQSNVEIRVKFKYNQARKPISTQYIKLKTLAMLSFNYKNGPWKHAYVKFGYNPEENKYAIDYQIIDLVVQDKDEYNYEQIKDFNPIKNAYDPSYREKPQNYRHMYMICEIIDDNVQKAFKKIREKIEKTDRIPNKKTGWMDNSDLKRLQKIMKDKFKFK